MGSTFLTKREAAQVLGLSVCTIFRMIARGALRPIRSGRYVGVSEEDVLALKKERDESDGQRTLPFPVNRETLLRLYTEQRIMRRELDQVLNVLNIRRTVLKVSDMEMVALYNTALEYCKDGWPPQVEETWAKYFQQMHTDNFLQLERRLKDPHPWQPFYKLVRTMQLRPYNTEILLQLAAGRERIQGLVATWAEIKGISPLQIDTMLAEDAKPSQRTVNVITRRQQKIAAKEKSVTG